MSSIFDKVLATVNMVGTDLPAYKELFNTILTTLPEMDQTVLKQRYEEALQKAEQAHDRAQSL